MECSAEDGSICASGCSPYWEKPRGISCVLSMVGFKLLKLDYSA